MSFLYLSYSAIMDSPDGEFTATKVFSYVMADVKNFKLERI